MKTVNTYQSMETKGTLLNANESPVNLAAAYLEEINEYMSKLPFQRYPDDVYESLLEEYAKYVQLDPDQIIVGNGSDEMLGLIIGTTINAGKKLYTLSLDFSMYDYYVSMYQGEMVKYPYGIEDSFDVESFIKMGKENNVDIIMFSNPNNPTGRELGTDDLIRIVEAFSDIPVVIDEAYGEFGTCSMIPYVNKYPNLYVTRTLSKAFALAAARIGFMMGNKESITKIRRYKVPYNVSRLNEMMGIIVLSHVEDVQNNIKLIVSQRDRFFEEYQEMNARQIILYPSKTNFIYGNSDKKEISIFLSILMELARVIFILV